jgi:hypothetical protein
MEATTENNKLIAEFMKYGVFEHFTNTHVFGRVRNEELLFHSDWNWLMEVVEKIESLKFSILIGKNTCVIEQTYGKIALNLGVSKGKTKIEAVYNACVEFIKWYNQNK